MKFGEKWSLFGKKVTIWAKFVKKWQKVDQLRHSILSIQFILYDSLSFKHIYTSSEPQT